MGRILSQRTFNVSPSIKIDAVSEKTAMAFRHLATVYKNGSQVGFGRIPYQNRTWESFEFQSVMEKAVRGSSLSSDEKANTLKWLQGDRTDWSDFKMTGMIAGLGDIMATTPKEKVAWKTRMLKAGLGHKGLDIPENFGGGDVNVQNKILDQVIGQISGVGMKSKVQKKLSGKKGGVGSADWVNKETAGVFK